MSEYIKSIRKHVGHERIMTVGSSIIIHKNGKLLLQKRNDNGCWGEHGGYAEIGETVENAAKRELFEETGLIANSLELVGVFSGEELFHTYPNGDMVANTDILYICEDFCGEISMQLDEVSDLQWFDIENLPKNISPPSIPGLMKCVEILKDRRKKEQSA
ncbi:MAG: NUDIX hydrolase [Defluviitaleaceae bacterium]|nr:NUDIX hydrolase [Defluviitaleaceae bacterium]